MSGNGDANVQSIYDRIPSGSIIPITADGKLDFGAAANPVKYETNEEKQRTYLQNYLNSGNFQNHQLFTECLSVELYGPAHAHLSIMAEILAKPETEQVQSLAVDAIAKFIGEYCIRHKIDGPLGAFSEATGIVSREKIVAVLEKLLERKDLPQEFRTKAETYLKRHKEILQLCNDKKQTIASMGKGIDPATAKQEPQIAIKR